MIENKKPLSFEEILAQAKTLKEWIKERDDATYQDAFNKDWEKLVSVVGLQQALSQVKDLIDNIPIDMQKVGENYEVYSIGTKKQWIDWLIHYNEVLGLGSGKETRS